MPRISAVDVVDVRFPTSATLAGSDAMHPDGDYSAAYVVLRTDTELSGHGLTFTIGRGTDLCVLAARHIAAPLVGRDVDELAASLGPTYRRAGRGQPAAWLGPEKGVVQLAAAAVLNAVWDLVARRAGKPLWRLVAEMEPADLVAACDFRYLSDVLTPDEALEMLERLAPSRAERIEHLAGSGYPAYTSGPGVAGLLRRRSYGGCAGRRWRTAGAPSRSRSGRTSATTSGGWPSRGRNWAPTARCSSTPNQVWEVPEAIAWVNELAQFAPLWIEEPTSPDDIVGHAAIRAAVAPVGVATGEHATTGSCSSRC